MKRNEGGIDRAVRIGAGSALIGLHLAGVLGPWAWIGIVPLLTGFAGNCPLYSLFGVSTCRTGSRGDRSSACKSNH